MRELLALLVALLASFGAAAQSMTSAAYAGEGPPPDKACAAINVPAKPTDCLASYLSCAIAAGKPTCALAGKLTGNDVIYLVWCRSTAQIVNKPDAATYTEPGCASSDPFSFRRNPPGVPGPMPTVAP